MRLARVEDAAGARFWVLLHPDNGTGQRINAPFSHWAGEISAGSLSALDLSATTLEPDTFRLVAPVEPGARIFGVGLNYLSHLTRLGSAAPPHPLAYIKPDSAIVDPDGVIFYPAMTAELDYEIELVAVIGKPLGDAVAASSCVMGYTVGNDISARDAGRALGRLDLFTQKGMDGTTPVGPWIATLDQLGGGGQPQLDMRMTINGEVRQQDNSREMIFTVDELLNYLDARITLRPGDLVFTGSTHGVGLETGRFLQPGDILEAHIEGVGMLRNEVGPQRILVTARQSGRLGHPAV
ncbi:MULTISPECIES: fumarylacetoacetate hydrolase family protein [Pseudomonas]|uniref:fumarylacetoacetate hydrolase family protein n=1 Tax=Pseudomonas TaxID=286 RepID=UPI00123B1CC5|nr:MULTISPECIES: fumarylacetoacetate hydrolase family protein [Pseudomonas]QIB51488.1 fumarylacetoacetate hydrolase family protein [Pseudomonas sp. OIL-1]